MHAPKPPSLAIAPKSPQSPFDMAAQLSVGTSDHVSSRPILEILRVAADHDLDALEKGINQYSFAECRAVDVQDPTTGSSPLHAAIDSCTPAVNGNGVAVPDREEAGALTIRLLLENGAIWNQLDKNDETPGCLAYRLGLGTLYQLMVDAGVRAEMLLSRLEGYSRLDDDDDEDDDEANEGEAEAPNANGTDEIESRPATSGEKAEAPGYLSSALSFSSNKLLDEEQNGVMMAWESGIMQQSADALLSAPGLEVLNIGFGMGIIDSKIQDHANKPASHHIVEAHPDVLSDMQSKGWTAKDGVVVHPGKWQDILPQLVAEGKEFDAIYFDTFAESYSEFREFFTEHVLALLKQDGRWSFFNGMGADRQISYDVYQKVVEMDLFECGFDVEWTDVDLPQLDGEWEGVRRKYWNVDAYRLPMCRFMD